MSCSSLPQESSEIVKNRRASRVVRDYAKPETKEVGTPGIPCIDAFECMVLPLVLANVAPETNGGGHSWDTVRDAFASLVLLPLLASTRPDSEVVREPLKHAREVSSPRGMNSCQFSFRLEVSTAGGSEWYTNTEHLFKEVAFGVSVCWELSCRCQA